MNHKCITSSLTGKNLLNPANITGKSLCNSEYIPSDVVKIKIYIMTNIIIPLVSKQWKTLQENLFCLDHIKKKLDTYYNCYKIEDMKIYKELINAFEAILAEHQQLEELEKTIYSGDSKDVTTMIYRTAMIRLKPEYEIYDILYGKPKRSENQDYNVILIEYIEHLLKIEGITFHKIKEYTLSKYPVIPQ
uniref:Uncharacterized protein n=1 Tax=viral metagenome TaxID=1070528 RepID=A0A6C0CV62_9ZZZZ